MLNTHKKQREWQFILYGDVVAPIPRWKRSLYGLKFDFRLQKISGQNVLMVLGNKLKLKNG